MIGSRWLVFRPQNSQVLNDKNFVQLVNIRKVDVHLDIRFDNGFVTVVPCSWEILVEFDTLQAAVSNLLNGKVVVWKLDLNELRARLRRRVFDHNQCLVVVREFG